MTLVYSALVMIVPMFSYAQAPGPEDLVLWSFDEGTGAWHSVAPTATLQVTADSNVIRGEEHGAVLEYSYVPETGALAGVFTPTGGNLLTAKSLRFWLRTTHLTLMLAIASEDDGSNYHAGFTSLPDRWQEIALDFSEFQLGEDSSDENNHLDASQIVSIGVIDATGMIAQLAAQVPFLVLPDLRDSVFWLDDVSLSAETVPPRWSATEIDGKRAVRLESFEATPLQWLVMAGKGMDLEYDSEYKAEGEFSLRLHYEVPPGKLIGILTAPKGPDLADMRRLRLWLMSEVACSVIISLNEQDGSNYNHMLDVQPGGQLQPFDLELAAFRLGQDSRDENGRLDLDQLKELVIADVSVLTGKTVPVNTLWVDDLVFTE